MLLPINNNQNVYIEITNPEHGGLGWELGTCLWSPVLARGGARAWKIMEKVQPGDFIIHLVDLNGLYHWYAISIAASSLIITNNKPPRPGKWDYADQYQRVNLEYFQPLSIPYPINIFFEKYDRELRSVLDIYRYKPGLFYVEYGSDKLLRVAQRYFASCPPELSEIFDTASQEIKFTPSFLKDQSVPTIHEPQNPDYTPPGRVKTYVSRIIRDTNLSRTVKEQNNWKCQICGNSILLPNGYQYAEGHHLKPLGGESQGPDTFDNIIILCPTHHTEFDYGSIAINPETYLIEHLDEFNEFHGKQMNYTRQDLNKDFIRFHYETRFKTF